MLLDKLIAKRVAEFESEILQKHYEEVENMYTKMRGWRHDYRHHIQTMKVHAANGEYEEIGKYLDMLDDDLTNVDTTIKTGRIMVDAILNGKMNIAAQNAIPVNAKAKIPENTPVTDVDLCVIIGNLLDNAVEENKKLPEDDRFIRVYIGQKNTQLYLAITNAAGKKQTKRGGLFGSSKGADHGFGLSRVESIVKKYGGLFSSDSEDGGFTAEILIPLT